MSRSLRLNEAYMRNSRAERMTPACARESLAARNPDPGGIVTRTGAPPGPPHAAIAENAKAASVALTRRSAGTLQRLLKDDGSRKSVDVFLAISAGPAHLVNCAQR